MFNNISSITNWNDLVINNLDNQNNFYTLDSPLLSNTFTFYSFKGGNGVTTSLKYVGYLLANMGFTVAILDLNFESPNLNFYYDSTLFQSIDYFDNKENTFLSKNLSHSQLENLDSNINNFFGIIDYFYQQLISFNPTISISQIVNQLNLKQSPGKLFFIPAGYFDSNYALKISQLYPSFILKEFDNITHKIIWHDFICKIKNQINPDIILIDSSTGLNKWTILSLFHTSNNCFVFSFPNKKNFDDLNVIFDLLNSSVSNYQLKFVFSFIPFSSYNSSYLHNIEKSFDLFLQHISSKQLSNLSIHNKPFFIPYLSSIYNLHLYHITSILKYYQPLADFIYNCF